MNKLVSVVIRNKNEGKALEEVLSILSSVYSKYIFEIILVDNHSTDNSLEVAEKYNCKITSISNFSYGRAINQGISLASSQYVLLLSSHAIPIGSGFFENTFKALGDQNVAGIRYVNSFSNYKRAIENNFTVTEPLKFGLMGACCLINKKVWQAYRFDEDLKAIEDKEWSYRVFSKGYKIIDLNETYFYFANRTPNASMNRFKNETIASYQLNNRSFPGPLRSIFSFLKKIFITNQIRYLKTIFGDINMLRIKIEIYESLKKSPSEK